MDKKDSGMTIKIVILIETKKLKKKPWQSGANARIIRYLYNQGYYVIFGSEVGYRCLQPLRS